MQEEARTSAKAIPVHRPRRNRISSTRRLSPSSTKKTFHNSRTTATWTKSLNKWAASSPNTCRECSRTRNTMSMCRRNTTTTEVGWRSRPSTRTTMKAEADQGVGSGRFPDLAPTASLTKGMPTRTRCPAHTACTTITRAIRCRLAETTKVAGRTIKVPAPTAA